jgi:hypothetical protein
MKNITKIMLALLTSVSLISNASAGDLTVTGTAKATYSSVSGGTAGADAKAGIGIANEIDFGATGELDNGTTWKYQVQFDPGATTNNGGVDDSQLTLTTGYGTLGLYVSEGGLGVDDSASQSVYGRFTDIGVSSGIVEGKGVDGGNNIQLHTPAGLLPLDASIKAAYAPSKSSSGIASSNKTGGASSIYGTSIEQIQVTLVPTDGLKVYADYYAEKGAGDSINRVVQQQEAGSVAAEYAIGAFSVGLSKTLNAPLILGSGADLGTNNPNSGIALQSATTYNPDSARLYTTRKGSVAYNVNDNLSISYEREESVRELIADATDVSNDLQADVIQAAYTMGGMTLALSHANKDGIAYAANNDVSETIFALTMAF